ncbi:MAG: CDP-alcohol phosphatidyltransferase family protein [Patescibacteria group bacterium]
MNLTNYLRHAEAGAHYLLRLKDLTLGALFNYLIPLPTRRKIIRQTLVKLVAYLSRPLSEAVNRGIENNTISVPNLFSLSRAVCGPLFIIFVHFEAGLEYYLLLISWAIFSDYADGVLAKKMDQETELGALLDAGCDKVFAICVALSFWNYLWLWPVNAIAFLVLDGTLAILATFLLRAKKRDQYEGSAEIKANWLGKVKYNLQGMAGFCYLFSWPMTGNYFLLSANLFAAGSLLRHLEPKNKP